MENERQELRRQWREENNLPRDFRQYEPQHLTAYIIWLEDRLISLEGNNQLDPVPSLDTLSHIMSVLDAGGLIEMNIANKADTYWELRGRGTARTQISRSLLADLLDRKLIRFDNKRNGYVRA